MNDEANKNKFTKDDLKEMQSWDLEKKIAVSKSKIIEFYNRFEGGVLRFI